ncbi:MAG: hypothetical protein RIQ84_1027 [Pseudomonadota bacterium]|jgi:hypothetical protein
MFLAWDGIATVVKAVSAVMIAEVLLAFFLQGYSEMSTILLIITISILLMLLGSFKVKRKNKGDDHGTIFE